MTGFFVVLALFVVVVLVMGVRHDRRQRGISEVGVHKKTNTRLDNQTRADEWGGP